MCDDCEMGSLAPLSMFCFECGGKEEEKSYKFKARTKSEDRGKAINVAAKVETALRPCKWPTSGWLAATRENGDRGSCLRMQGALGRETLAYANQGKNSI